MSDKRRLVQSDLFKVQPEVLLDKSRAELNEAAFWLIAIGQAFLAPGLSLEDARRIRDEEMTEVRTLIAVALNEWAQGNRQRAKLQSCLDLWNDICGDSAGADDDSLQSLKGASAPLTVVSPEGSEASEESQSSTVNVPRSRDLNASASTIVNGMGGAA